MTRPLLVRLTWLDSASSHGWLEKCEINRQPTKVHSAGFIVSESKKSITISTSYYKEGRFMDPLTIPKCCIVKRKDKKDA